jgi:hypothetical protein
MSLFSDLMIGIADFAQFLLVYNTLAGRAL